jgi:hypothetical protein
LNVEIEQNREVNKSATQQTALIEFLREFAGHMLSAGLSLEQFENAARTAFIQAAAAQARLGNSRVNQSAVAALTGLSRPQVRKYLRQGDDEPAATGGRLGQVLDAWQKDQEYVSGNGSPAGLPIRGRERSFESLVKKYGRDVSYKALLVELQKLKYVRSGRGRVALTPKGRRHFEPRELNQIASGLAFALRRHSPAQSEISVFTAEAVYPTPSLKSRLLIKKRLVQSTKAFAADIKATGDAEAVKSRATKAKLSRASILVLTIGSKNVGE